MFFSKKKFFFLIIFNFLVKFSKIYDHKRQTEHTSLCKGFRILLFLFKSQIFHKGRSVDRLDRGLCEQKTAGGVLHGEYLGGSEDLLIDASLTAHPLSSGKRAPAQMRHGFPC